VTRDNIKKEMIDVSSTVNANDGENSNLFPSELEPGTPTHKTNAKTRSGHPLDTGECQNTGMWIIIKDLIHVGYMFRIPLLQMTRRH
jgi:hypothetical protein